MGYKYRDGIEKNRLIYARWFLTMLTGVGTALVAVFLLYCTTLLMSLKQHLLVYSIQHELAKHVLFGTTFWSIMLFNLVLVAIAATLTSFGEPVAAGSGSYTWCLLLAIVWFATVCKASSGLTDTLACCLI